MTKVYIVNKSAHNFEPAKKWGELIALSEGSINPLSPNSMHRTFSEVMADSTKDDYILLSGLSIMSVVAATIFATKHQKLNLLIFLNGEYYERNLVFG